MIFKTLVIFVYKTKTLNYLVSKERKKNLDFELLGNKLYLLFKKNHTMRKRKYKWG